jgi:hypothetical protein
MFANDPGALPLADNVRFTEDTVQLKLGEGLWLKASKHGTYRQDFIDVRHGVAGAQVVVYEDSAPVSGWWIVDSGKWVVGSG